MKRLLIIPLVLVITGCAWFQPKAPPTRFGVQLLEVELSKYEMAMMVKKFLYGKILIGDLARDHINSVGTKVFENYHISVDTLADFREGRVGLYSIESDLDKLNRVNSELSTTINAYLAIILEGTK